MKKYLLFRVLLAVIVVFILRQFVTTEDLRGLFITVGQIVGGLVGIAVAIVLILLIFRVPKLWRRRKEKRTRASSQPSSPEKESEPKTKKTGERRVFWVPMLLVLASVLVVLVAVLVVLDSSQSSQTTPLCIGGECFGARQIGGDGVREIVYDVFHHPGENLYWKGTFTVRRGEGKDGKCSGSSDDLISTGSYSGMRWQIVVNEVPCESLSRFEGMSQGEYSNEVLTVRWFSHRKDS